MTDGRTYSFPAAPRPEIEPLECAPIEGLAQQVFGVVVQLTGSTGQFAAAYQTQLGVYGTEADTKARTLLLSLLTPEQREEYETTRYFHVTRDGKQYELGDNLKVYVRDLKKKTLENWCAFVANAPRCDTIIAQLLMIRDDPEKLRRMANVTFLTDYNPRLHYRPVEEQRPGPARGISASVARLLRRAGYLTT